VNLGSTANVLSIGGTDPLHLRLSFVSGALRIVSNWGAAVGLSAPGFHVNGPLLGNKYSGGGVGSRFSDEGGIGNSFSAALATGAASILKSLQPGLDPPSLKSILINSGDTIVTDHPIGGRRLNVLCAVEKLLPSPRIVDDNFNTDSPDCGRWDLTVAPPGVGIVREANQELEMTKVGSGTTYQGLASRFSVSGDFDVQVDYRLLTWPHKTFIPCDSPPRTCRTVSSGMSVSIGTAMAMRTTSSGRKAR